MHASWMMRENSGRGACHRGRLLSDPRSGPVGAVAGLSAPAPGAGRSPALRPRSSDFRLSVHARVHTHTHAHARGQTTSGRGLCRRLLAPRAPVLGSVPSLCRGSSSFWNALPAQPLLLGNVFIRSQLKPGHGLLGPRPVWPSCGARRSTTRCHPACTPVLPTVRKPHRQSLTCSVLTGVGTAVGHGSAQGHVGYRHCHTEAETKTPGTHVCLNIHAALLPGALSVGRHEGPPRVLEADGYAVLARGCPPRLISLDLGAKGQPRQGGAGARAMLREVEPKSQAGGGFPSAQEHGGPSITPAHPPIHILSLLGGPLCHGCQGARGLQVSPALGGAAGLAGACTLLQTVEVGRVPRPSAEAACSGA